ncbi:aminopeptidase P family protein [Bacteroides salyersiae]|uniref:aminopeptidase P family protein n=3 Tax=Bacteroides salyersiae TaxID=291644 RepID=UPI001C38EEBB|nr:aminopeptidase P family protein [Bacteroides salyersiae]MBV4205287.1 aminopeptidase P family protein [Bacteroides salyersiae]MCB6650586.1 aminopeptidase P family protein [Bacteroides salyersiae]UBD16712.1 aminopeptidase P family protein [Bacteroides salyersiae]UBD65661.1 aminopeptidase P family protein [Bacteroides salyersiae]
MQQTVKERIRALRMMLKSEAISAFIIPSTDPHLSEYVASYWKTREWISGFTGSAGTIVILKDKAGLWTDSRYFLQAAQQLEGTDITLYKEMLPETPTIIEFICQNLLPGETVGIDGKMFSANQVEQMKQKLETANVHLKDYGDLPGKIWNNRPDMPDAPAFIYDLKYAGKSCEEKIASIRTEIQKQGTDGLFISALDEIAWTLNLRGSDVHCNPVIISYLLITQNNITFFVSPQKITEEIKNYLEEQQVSIQPYSETEDYLRKLNIKSISLNPNQTNYAIYSAINPACRINHCNSPITLLKAIRNEQEIAGIHAAMRRDGIALVRFLKWLEEAVVSEKETELSIDQKLHEYRAAQTLYMGESFDTIAGYREHAAIVHYSATPDTNAILYPKGFLLIDSGAQYLDGTTDITRTIALGELTEEEKTDYTLILKGHIALAMAKFPAGTRGSQLDVLARMPIWQYKMNFLHGTGHGVGHFLSVHEGPQSIRMNENPVVLQPGMVTSNEPGVYKAGKHGIRTENLTLVRRAGEGMFGDYLEFETITLCPICKKGIIKKMLTEEEVTWLNTYHQNVYDQLAPDLNEEEKMWLKEATAAI